MPAIVIRPMRATDIEPASAAILAEDWGDRRAWFAFATAHDSCRVVVAEIGGEIVGTGVTTINGPAAWIGTIWVAKHARRRGLGRELTQATIDAAREAGCRTLVLVATDVGRPLYQALGFEVQTWYRTVEAPGNGGTERPADPRVRPYRLADLPVMAALDRAATGEDRAHLLEAFAAPGTTRIVVDPDDVARGFVIRAPWGGGATIAPHPDDALTILEARRRGYDPGRRIRAGILAENEAGAALLERAGWTEAWRAPRLIRGDPLDWDPRAIWGQFNHALG